MLPVIGVDEVGRGCLAGPVFASAVILRSEALNHVLTDSKLLTPKKREELKTLILSNHHAALGSSSVEEIDELNILQASLLAMKRAVLDLTQRLQIKEAIVLVDGPYKIPDLDKCFQQTPMIKGDLNSPPISAASIVAKVTRDQLMSDLDTEYPGYGFSKHKGYLTKLHKDAIQRQGPCSIHRKSFAGVKEYFL